MFKSLLYLGLLTTPFAFFPGFDIRDMKMACAFFMSMALVAVGIYFNGLKPFKNKWLIALLIYLPVSIGLSPAPKINLIGIDVSFFWVWEPLLYILLFSFLAFSIASEEMDDFDMDNVLNVMFLGGFLTALYMILQFFFLDQFFEPQASFLPGRGNVAGFIGNPTLTAPFVAMTIPFAVYFRRYFCALIMIVSVFLTNSQVGYGSMILSILFYFSTQGKAKVYISAVLVILGALFVIFSSVNTKHPFFEDNGRLQMWKLIAKDIKDPIAPGEKASYPLTGRGLGSFKYVFHTQHPGTETEPNRFFQAHNDYLEFAYGVGLAGLCLLLMAIWDMFKKNYSIHSIFWEGFDRRRAALLSSFVCVGVAACGTFVWQIGTMAFYSAVVVGLLYNGANLKGEFA